MSDYRTSSYLHGSASGEQARLSVLNRLINDACLREFELRAGERVLDVGCGLGQFTRLLARAVAPGGIVVGVERDPRQLEAAQNVAGSAAEIGVDLRAGDALALPLRESEWGGFDVAHARFVLEHVRDPRAVVRQMVQAVRPGGRIVLADDDHAILRLWPEPPGFGPFWEAYVRTYDRLGNDPYVGRRLVWLLHTAGAIPIRNTWLFFGACTGDANFEAIVENLVGILEGARETMLAQGLIDAEWFGDGIAAIRRWGRRPDAAFWYAVAWAEGTRPLEGG